MKNRTISKKPEQISYRIFFSRLYSSIYNDSTQANGGGGQSNKEKGKRKKDKERKNRPMLSVVENQTQHIIN